MMRSRITLALVAVTVGAAGAPAVADAAPRKFRNCTAMHRVHPHGVAKSRATAASATGLTGRPTISRALYVKNKGLDRDHDGVACEA